MLGCSDGRVSDSAVPRLTLHLSAAPSIVAPVSCPSSATQANGVTRSNDPTAHAEVCAIRAACASLKTFRLSGHAIVTSCYPCAMCFGACYWSHVDAVVYVASAADAASASFDDVHIYEEIARPEGARAIPFVGMSELSTAERLRPFTAWAAQEGKTAY